MYGFIKSLKLVGFIASQCYIVLYAKKLYIDGRINVEKLVTFVLYGAMLIYYASNMKIEGSNDVMKAQSRLFTAIKLQPTEMAEKTPGQSLFNNLPLSKSIKESKHEF